MLKYNLAILYGDFIMSSMTGYGRAEYSENGINLLVEIKTVNNRNFDLNIKSPRSFLIFDDLIRKTVQNYVKRGRTDVFVTFADKRECESDFFVNMTKARNYFNASESIARELGLDNDVTVGYLLKAPDVLSDNGLTDVSEFEQILKDTVDCACINLNKMRNNEGVKLVGDMLSRLEVIKSLRERIKERAPDVAKEYRDKLKKRIEEILADVKYDEAKLLSEVAFFTDRVNIDEELTRLNSHISQFTETVNTEGAGKKLDFLMQEFNREANTICSKSNDIEITRLALAMKNEIEKIREQVQNIE